MKMFYMRPGGATVARLTPDQKVACSNHVRVKTFYFKIIPNNIINSTFFSFILLLFLDL